MLKGLRHARTGFAQVVAALALIAIAVRALAPAGYMLGADGDGRFISVVLCGGQGAMTAFIDRETGAIVDAGATHDDETPSKRPGADAPCVFATLAPLGAPAAQVIVAAPSRTAHVALTTPRLATPGRGLAAPPPWATGPPLTV